MMSIVKAKEAPRRAGGRGGPDRQVAREGIMPNPKLNLMDQVSEVVRLKHYSIRTERCYRD